MVPKSRASVSVQQQVEVAHAFVLKLSIAAVLLSLHSAAASQELSQVAMSVALDHPALHSDARFLCDIACTCKGWQEAVQQCSPISAVTVVINTKAPPPHLAGFASWLSRHAALFNIIAVCSYAVGPGQERQGLQLLKQALQQAALTTATSPAESQGASSPPAAMSRPAAAHVQAPQARQGHQQLRSFRLQSMEAEFRDAPNMLAALPAASLTR
jgi:hypothetical protein